MMSSSVRSPLLYSTSCSMMIKTNVWRPIYNLSNQNQRTAPQEHRSTGRCQRSRIPARTRLPRTSTQACIHFSVINQIMAWAGPRPTRMSSSTIIWILSISARLRRSIKYRARPMRCNRNLSIRLCFHWWIRSSRYHRMLRIKDLKFWYQARHHPPFLPVTCQRTAN